MQELSLPVEYVDPIPLVLVQEADLLPVVEVRPTKELPHLMLLERSGRARSRRKVSCALIVSCVSPSSTLRSSDSLVVSTAWESMSTP